MSLLPSLKKTFPFYSGTTSYLYPFETDNLTRNVDLISEAVDVIQLLFFGKNYLDELITEASLETLKIIQTEKKIKYCIHLPTDFDLMNPQKNNLTETLACIQKILAACKELHVDYFILHMDRCENFTYPEILWDIKAKKQFSDHLKAISSLFSDNPHRLCIENTAFSLECVKEEIIEHNVSVCCDTGHLMLKGLSFEPMYRQFQDRCPVLHIHGVQNGKDHIALTQSSPEYQKALQSLLKNYRGSVILEVFNEKDFIDSALWMRQTLTANVSF